MTVLALHLGTVRLAPTLRLLGFALLPGTNAALHQWDHDVELESPEPTRLSNVTSLSGPPIVITVRRSELIRLELEPKPVVQFCNYLSCIEPYPASLTSNTWFEASS
jgi:hypothetical protein